VPDIVVDDNEVVVVDNLHVKCLAVPGHSDGSVVWEIEVNGSRNWFIGDLYSTVTAHTGVLLPWMGDINSDLNLYTRSLERLLDEPNRPRNIFPGHGPSAIGFGYLTLEMAYRQVLSTWRSGTNQQ
jgi:glyoxylase-like metal-dependent hydrolase (beta-lactamase superfamily II)